MFSLFFKGSLGLTFLLAFNLFADDWPNYMGPKYDGVYEETGLKLDFNKDKPKRVWRAKVKTGFSSITTMYDKVYSMGHSAGKDYVFCLDDKTGNTIWSKTYKAELQPNLYEGGPNATPTVYDGLVYTFGKHGQFHCWDANTGAEKWSVNVSEKYGYKSPDWGFSGSPYIHGDLVLINAGSAGIAFNRKSGEMVWKSDNGKASYASIIPYSAGGKDEVLLFGANKLICLNATNGKKSWDVNWKTSYDVNSANPAIYGKDIFISSGYGKGAGLVKVNGNRAAFDWTNNSMRNHFSCSIIKGDYVYGIDGNTNDRNASLKCMRLKDGRVMWSEGLGFGTIAMANDKLLVLREKGQLVSVDVNPEKYVENGRIQILGGKCWTSPIVSNGHIYARNARGDLVKFSLK